MINLGSLKKRIDFIKKLEELKNIERGNMVLGGNRKENSAEHSWHVAMMALILAPEFPNVDLFRVIKMLLIHDTVEIYAGDTFIYSENTEDQKDRELEALDKLYNLLPNGDDFKQLWYEFEEAKTPEGQFARALDMIQPVINYEQVGIPYKDQGPISVEEVYEKKKKIKEFSPSLWKIAVEIIEKSREQGLYL